jgi:hypothetical protein
MNGTCVAPAICPRLVFDEPGICTDACCSCMHCMHARLPLHCQVLPRDSISIWPPEAESSRA